MLALLPDNPKNSKPQKVMSESTATTLSAAGDMPKPFFVLFYFDPPETPYITVFCHFIINRSLVGILCSSIPFSSSALGFHKLVVQ